MNDSHFLTSLLDCTLPAEHFNHHGHLRLGWLMLQSYPLPEAVQRTCFIIQRYATSLGAADKYHATLTLASVLIIADHAQGSASDFAGFLAENSALSDQFPRLIAQHYSQALLQQPKAKTGFLVPDKQPFTQPLEGILACTPLARWPS